MPDWAAVISWLSGPPFAEMVTKDSRSAAPNAPGRRITAATIFPFGDQAGPDAPEISKRGFPPGVASHTDSPAFGCAAGTPDTARVSPVGDQAKPATAVSPGTA